MNLLALLMGYGLSKRAARLAVIGITISLLAGLAWLTLHLIRSDAVQDHEAAVTSQVSEDRAKAAETAADARARDTIAIANDTQEARNANAAIPDAAPTRQSIARNCARMRRLGADTSGLPACGGSDRPR